jgi:DNA-binding CsgD family transcriptional regulator
MKNCIVILFLVTGIFSSFCQNSQNTIGIPDIINYPKSIYNAGIANWDIVQDKNGIVYFANTEGLLSFDGAYWKTYTFPNKTMGRSLAIGNDNRIYAGTDDDFGYFSPDKNGRLFFHSMQVLLSEKNRSFPGIWDIVPNDNDIFFRSESKMFRYNNGAVSVYPAAAEWRFLGCSNKQVIAQDSKNGLLKFTNGVWSSFLEESTLPSNYVVTAIVPFGKDSSLITTMKNGLFILSGNKVTNFRLAGTNPFANELILSCTPVNKNWVAVGTQLNGCYIINKQGEVIQNFSRKEGLQNNCVISLYLDKNQNLWMGLDNGIDFTACNNGIKHIYPEHLNEGAGYSSIIYKNELYIGTSNMLYRLPVSGEEDMSFKKGNFMPIADTKGSAWGLYEVNGDLLMAHHEGAFKIKNGTSFQLSKVTGYWTFVPFYNVLPSSLIVAGKYNGLDFFHYHNNVLEYKTSLSDFKAGVRFAAVDNNNIIWVAQIYKGVYKIDMDSASNPSVKLYTDKNGLPSAIGNKLFKIRNHIVVTTEKGIYEYNEKKDVFENSAWLKPIFGERNIRYLKEDGAGNIWFVEDKMPGVVDFSNQKPKTIFFPELNGKIVSGFENINPIDKSNIIIGAEKGFYHINYEQYKKNSYQIEARIRSVRAIGKTDSLLFGGYFGEASDTVGQTKNAIPKVANKWNSFHFEYSSPLNEHQNSVEYSYMLKGLDDKWSSWSKKTEKEYTKLRAGDYMFYVKAKNYLGNESAVSSFSFSVLPPWYQTTTAYIIYLLFFLAGNYVLYNMLKKKFRAQQKKHEEEQRRLLYLHQLELEKSEKEIIALKNEKLQVQIQHKNTELASVAMHLVQKGELLTKIKEELTRIKNGNGNGHSNGNGDGNGNGNVSGGHHDNHNTEEFKKIIRILKEEDKLDKDWEHFAIHFDNVHSDFLKDLKEHYPNLSANELKLCAYLRMNLSSKEIAQLMNISVRGVEISRYRLRKKLQIPTETNLFDFLMKFTSAKTH